MTTYRPKFINSSGLLLTGSEMLELLLLNVHVAIGDAKRATSETLAVRAECRAAKAARALAHWASAGYIKREV